MAVLGWRGVVGNRTRWCPSCDADLSKTQVRTCDRCGYSSSDEASFHQPRRRWWIVIVGLSVVLVSSMFAVGWDLPARSSRFILSDWIVTDARELPYDWKVERMIAGDADPTGHQARIRLSQGGETHYDWRGGSADLGFLDPRSAKRVGLGTDVDRDGTPDLVIRVSSNIGGTPEWILLSLADRRGSPRIQPTAVLVDGSFRDVDGDGRFEFQAEDSGLRNRWFEPSRFEGPSIVLSPRETGWSFDEELSRRRSIDFDPDLDPMEVLADAASAWTDVRRPFVSTLFNLAFQLASHGRDAAAIELLGSDWPGDDRPSDVSDFETIE
ncbi:MAG: hypothetical protein VX672_05865, partial [Planctomycetota bacterium]|nr:hypothetical protein [Planctomycetota bacterium]